MRCLLSDHPSDRYSGQTGKKEYALIVAGGKGTRFDTKAPKQFAVLRDKPVLLHAVEAFYRYSDKISIVLVLPEEHISVWQDICRKHQVEKNITLQPGGASRFQSVKNGLEQIPDDGYVAIHDGVRPLVSIEIISASFRLAKLHGVAVAAVPLKDSIRMMKTAASDAIPKSSALDRALYRLIQTPQTFSSALIKKAYEMAEDASLTDDASVAERAGHPIHLFPGDFKNIKITTPEDLIVAQALLAGR